MSQFKILYISDLHLDDRIADAKCETLGDEIRELYRVGAGLQKSYEAYCGPNENAVVVLAGDTAETPKLLWMFMCLPYSFVDRTIVVLGNHEFWAYPGKSVADIVQRYQELMRGAVAQNEILLFEDCDEDDIVNIKHRIDCISCADAMEMSVENLAQRMSTARMVMLAGNGFSGYNVELNAENEGLYRGVVSRKQEIAETEMFEALYHRFVEASRLAPGRGFVVVTHTPMKDWNSEVVYEDGFIYIRGHTHNNYSYDDGCKHIYADNQNGHEGRNPVFKCICVDLPTEIGGIMSTAQG